MEENTQKEEFNWDVVTPKGFGEDYTTEEKSRLSQLYESTLTQIQEKEVIKGKVVGITAREVIVNIGFKSDGLVPVAEFRDTPELKVGDEVEVYIEEQENISGQLVLSRRKAKLARAWDLIQSTFDNDAVIEGFVKRRTKGGLIVDVYGIEAFLPGSRST